MVFTSEKILGIKWEKIFQRRINLMDKPSNSDSSQNNISNNAIPDKWKNTIYIYTYCINYYINYQYNNLLYIS